MNIIGCLDRPTQGAYYLNGINVMELDETELARIRNQRIGFVFQQFHLLPRLSAVHNVELALIYGDVGKRERRRRALAILDRVGLADRVHYFPNQLSGGQKQRVAIARALVTEPDFILADEPTGALDSVSGKQIMEIFKQLNQGGKTIIMVTHERDVASFASRKILIRDGSLVQNRRGVL
jgi:putative ABC transport system ATP-binding protein